MKTQLSLSLFALAGLTACVAPLQKPTQVTLTSPFIMANHKLFIDSGFLAETEGGISRVPATIDPMAMHAAPNSGNPPAHTNRGVTWALFKGIAPQIGLKADTVTFLAMTAKQAHDVFYAYAWKGTQGDVINSQAIAEYFAHFMWGSGYAGTYPAGIALQNFLKKEGKNYGAHDGWIGGQTAKALNELLAEKPHLEKTIYDVIHNARQTALRGFYNYAQNPGWRSSQNKLYALGISRISTLTAVEREAKSKVDSTFNLNDWRRDYATELRKAITELSKPV
jgi:lysozyme family protein